MMLAARVGSVAFGSVCVHRVSRCNEEPVAPSYFQPAKPYPEWDKNWDGRRHEKAGKATRHIILVRHGQYDETNKEDWLRVLTPLGRKQAELTGVRLREIVDAASPHSPVRMHVSTLQRARETADIIAPMLGPRCVLTSPDARLAEGRPAQHVPSRKPYSEEVVAADGKRIEAAFRSIFRRATLEEAASAHTPAPEDEYEIVVCHGNVTRYMALRALQLPPEAWLRYQTFNCSLTYIIVRPSGGVQLRTLGDIGHLPMKAVTFSMHHGFEW